MLYVAFVAVDPEMSGGILKQCIVKVLDLLCEENVYHILGNSIADSLIETALFIGSFSLNVKSEGDEVSMFSLNMVSMFRPFVIVRTLFGLIDMYYQNLILYFTFL